MARSRDLSKVLSSSTALATDAEIAATSFYAGKNKIINGDFGIWQRGTSSTSLNGFIADRWRNFWDGNGTFTVSQQSFSPGAAPVSGYESQFFQRIALNTTGTTTYYQTIQQIEDVRVLANQTATLSFWAKANTNTTLTTYIEQNFGSGGSSTVLVGANNFSLTTSWQRFNVTVSMPSISGKTIGTSSFLQITFRSFSIAASAFIDLWGVQFEPGSTATVFVPAGGGSQQAELALCQRYYEVMYMGNSVTANNDGGFQSYFGLFKVTKRTSPTYTASDSSSNMAQVGLVNLTFSGDAERFNVATSRSESGGVARTLSGFNLRASAEF